MTEPHSSEHHGTRAGDASTTALGHSSDSGEQGSMSNARLDRTTRRRGFLAGSVGALAALSARAEPARSEPARNEPSQATVTKAGHDAPRLFQVGTVTYDVAKDWDLPTLIAMSEKLGLKAVELRTTHKHGVEPSLTQAQRQQVRERFEKTTVKLLALGSTCEFHSPNPDVVKKNIAQAGEFLRLAHDVGAAAVKVRPNGLATKQGVPLKTTLKQIGDSLRQCGELAEPLGVDVWLEVHGSGTSLPTNIRSIIDICAHPRVGVTWNSNATDVKNGSIKENFHLLRKDIRNVHLHDLYSGYPFRELFTLLRETKYDAYTMAELSASRDPERVLRYFVALWNELSRPADGGPA